MMAIHSLAADGNHVACVIYARVSTAKQARENISIEVQIDECRKYAASLGWTVVGEYVDAGASGRSEKNRPQFSSMIENALEPDSPIKVIVVFDHSRFYRNVGLSEVTRFRLGLNGVQVQSVTQPIEDDGLMGSLAITIQAAVDENHSRMTATKVRSGLLANANAGFYNGGVVPFGYQLEERERRGTKVKNVLAIDPDEAPVAKHIFDLCEQGLGYAAIIQRLHEEGIKNRQGKSWYKSAIGRILSSSTYVGRHMFRPTHRTTGKVVPRAEWVEIPCPAIVGESTFQNVQRLLKERSPAVTAPRTTTSRVLLGKVAHCGSCGAKLQIATGTSRNKTVHHYYKCSARLNKGRCSGGNPVSIARDVLDNSVIAKVVDELLSANRVKEIVERAHSLQSTSRETASSRIAQLKRQLQTARRKEGNLWELASEIGVKARAGFLERLDTLQEESAGIERQIQAQQALIEKSVRPLSDKEASERAAAMRDLLLNASSEMKRRFISAVVEKVVVHDDKIVIYGPESSLAEAANDIDICVASPVRGSDREWWTS